MADGTQLSFGDRLLSNRRKISKLSKHLHKLDQIIDRLSFQRFVGINLDQKIFKLVNQQLEAKGLMVKKGTIVDASILPSSGRPLSDKKRADLAEQPSSKNEGFFKAFLK